MLVAQLTEEYCESMGLENGKFTPEHAKIPEHLERPSLSDMVPGTLAYVQETALFVDEAGLCWLNSLAHLMSELEVGADYLKVVRLDEGYVLDQYTNTHAPSSYRRFSFDEYKIHLENTPTDFNTDLVDETAFIPVIGIIVSPTQALQLNAAFKSLTGNHYLSKQRRNELLKPTRATKQQLQKNKPLKKSKTPDPIE